MKKKITEISGKKSNIIKENKERIRVAAYARVSTLEDEQLNSLITQTSYFKEYISTHDGWDLVNIYYDQGISGTSMKKREGFNQMIQDALNGKIDLILVKSISRFARNTVDALQTVRKLKEKNVTVFFEKENIDSIDAKSEIMLTMFMSFAQEESRSISENVKWSIQKNNKNGKVKVAYSSFYGYKRADKFSMAIEPKEANVVRMMYRLFLEGNSIHQISAYIASLGIKTKKGNPFRIPAIRNILTNEKYKGDAILEKTFISDFITHKPKKNRGEMPQYYVENDHDAIIPKATWNEVQNIFYNRNDKFIKYIFSSKIICLTCGSTFFRKTYCNPHYSNHFIIWECSNKYTAVKCNNPKIYEFQLFQLAHEVILHLFDKYPEIIIDIQNVINSVIKQKTRKEKLIKKVNRKKLPKDLTYEHSLIRLIIKSITINASQITFILKNGLSYTFSGKRMKPKDV